MADEQDININIGINPSKAESGSKATRAAVNNVVAGNKELDAAFRRLKSAIDPTFAAQDKYNKSLAEAKKLLDANMISRKEYNAAVKMSKAALDEQLAALNRNNAAQRAATQANREQNAARAADAKRTAQAEVEAARLATQQKIDAARRERAEKAKLEQQERQAIKLAAQLARQAALDAQRSAAAPSKRAVGHVDPALAEGARSVAQLEYAIERAMGKAERLAQQATAAAGRAASATSTRVAEIAQASAQKSARAAEETRDRVIMLEREKAAVIAAEADRAAQEVKAAEQQKKAAAQNAAAAAVKAAQDRKKADQDAAQAARQAAKAIEDQARAERQLSAAADDLRASVNPQFAAQQRYNEVMQRATQLLMANKLQTGEWTQIQKQAKAQMDVNVRSMGRMNSMYVQLGYQAQDVTASLASGINPLVILAQQGGQTAAALSTMGGTVGRVASFFAGPWGAAIIGATMLLGYFIDSTDEAKDKTVDLMNAESRRAAKLPELTQALRDFNKEQREANTNEAEALRLKGLMVQQTRQEAQTNLTAALRRVQELKDQIASVTAAPTEGSEGALAVLYWQLSRAESKVKQLRREFTLLDQGDTELDITRALRDAEAATDELTAARQRHDREEATITNNQRIRNAQIRRTMTGEAETLALRQSNKRATDELAASIRRLNAEEARINATRREGRTTQETARFQMPVAGPITSGFGARESFRTANGARASTNHAGIDIGASSGAQVRAAADGVVKFFGFIRGFGNIVELDHGAGVTSRYAHLSGFAPGMQQGQTVGQGQYIGNVGMTGNATGPHLHYEVRINGKPVDPRKGVFPVDELDREKDALNELERAQHELAQNTVAGYERQQRAIEANTELSNEEQMRQMLELQDQKIAVLRDAYGAESKEVEDAEGQKYQIIQRYNQLILRDTIDRIRKQAQIAEVREQSTQDVETEQLGGRSDVVDYRASTGIVSERQGLIEKAGILDEEYQLQQTHEERMYQLKLSYLQQELTAANQTPERQREIQNQIETMEAEHLARRMVAQEQYARRVADINRQQAEITMNKWREITQTFTGGVTSAFQGLWTRSITVQQALINMADQMVYKFVDMAARAAQGEIENWIRVHILKQNLQTAELARTQGVEAAKTATVIGGTTAQTAARATAAATETTINTATVGAKVAGEAIKTGAAVTGAATQTGVAATAGMTEIGTNAAVAAAGAYKSTVVIPFIGPVAAPAAAALALAAVLGFGALISARGGQGEVGEDGQLSLLHKKEMVLPEKFATPLRAALTTRTSSGMIGAASAAGSSARDSITNNSPSAQFNYQPNHTNMGADMETLLRKDGRTLRKWFMNEVRNGSLKLP